VDGRIEGIRVCSEVPRINHLFFADDSLVLLRACRGDAQELRRILQVYENASGQVTNQDTCSVLFSPNTKMEDKNEVRQALNIMQEAKNERYLRLPVSIGKSRKAFEYIKKKVWLRIQGWQEKLLNVDTHEMDKRFHQSRIGNASMDQPNLVMHAPS
jgi:hypothetical protein